MLQVLDSGTMDQSALDKYLEGMDRGEGGDGIILSAAVRLYGRPILIVTPDGGEQKIDTANASCIEPIRLGLINANHYVSINSVSWSKNADTRTSETYSQPQEEWKAHTLDQNHSDDLSVQSETSDCTVDDTAAAAPPQNQAVDTKIMVCRCSIIILVYM